MIGVEGILSVAAYATAVIASLQAGSRAKYLLEHNEIGVKSGPLIQPPTGNETSPLWDLVQVFQQSVQLGLMHHLDGEDHGLFVRQLSLEQIDASKNEHDHNIEPYSLSPFPKAPTEDERLDHLVDMYIQEAKELENNENTITRRVKSLLAGPSATATRAAQATKYWMARAWYWRKSREEFEEEFLEDMVNDGR